MEITSSEKSNEYDRVFHNRIMEPNECEEVFDFVGKDYGQWTFKKFKLLSKTFPSNIFVTVKKDSREIVATVSAIPTFPGQHILGVLIVREDYRRMGLGTALMQYVITRPSLNPGTFTLTAYNGFTRTPFPGLCRIYEKIGFQTTTPLYHVVAMTVNKASVREKMSSYDTNDTVIEPYEQHMYESLRAYDVGVRGYDGGRFLSVMVNVADYVLVAISKASKSLTGYAVVEDRKPFLVVNGLYADRDDIALLLFSTLLDASPNKTEIQLRVVQPHDFLAQFGEKLPRSYNYTRMANGPTAPMQLTKAYSILDHTE